MGTFAARSAVALILLALAGGDARAQTTLLGIAFPDRIAGASRAGPPRDFEKQQAGLGYGIEYALAGWKIDVFVYDFGRRSIPDDPLSSEVVGQLKQATGDILDAYTNVEARLRYAILDEEARVRFLCTSFAFTDKRGERDSFLCVTAFRNKFIKFRLTTNRRAGSDVVANDFVKAWVGVLR